MAELEETDVGGDDTTLPLIIEEPGEEPMVRTRDDNIATVSDVPLVDLAQSEDQFFNLIL